MDREISFLPSNDPRINKNDIQLALKIAEDVFQMSSDPAQIASGEENVKWTIEKIPFSWTLILMAGECIGSVAVLPTPTNPMELFLTDQIDEKSLIEIAQSGQFDIAGCDCIYLSGASILPKFQNRGIGSRALIHTVEATSKNLLHVRHLYCWPFTGAGKALVRKIRMLKKWDIQEKIN
jgi:GNAT superfamily N-acetyltransferase